LLVNIGVKQGNLKYIMTHFDVTSGGFKSPAISQTLPLNTLLMKIFNLVYQVDDDPI
jgi:hypothetical protein